MIKRLSVPFTAAEARKLKSGDSVLLSGTIYTARDAAHKRLCELLAAGKALPIDLKNATIYYVGPTPEKDGRPIGSAGPTTAYRMDAYAPVLMEAGVTGMIGKGKRGENVVSAMKKRGAVYFGAIGGTGALLSKCIRAAEALAWPELGAEALLRLEVQELPAIVLIDSLGNDLYELGPRRYLAEHGGEKNGLPY